MKSKIMFIIFPGAGTTSKYFSLNYPLKESEDPMLEAKRNSNLIPELKKIGKIHFVEPKWNNLDYYDKWVIENNQRYLHKKDINFTFEDLNIKKYCDKVYDKVKDFKGKFVLIGHSIGALWIYYFSKKYHSRIIYNFIIDGSKISPKLIKLRKKIQLKRFKKDFKSKKINNIKNSDIKELLINIKNKNHNLDELQSFVWKLNTLVYSLIFLNFPENIKKLKVNTIQFRNLNMESTEGIYKKKLHSKEQIKDTINEEEYFSKNNINRYKTIYFVNRGHSPHGYVDSRDIILNTIKGYLL